MSSHPCNIIITADTEEEAYKKLEVVSRDLAKWVNRNGLCLDLKKTQYMLFKTTVSNIKISISCFITVSITSSVALTLRV
jgi:hypothetical protein